MLIQPNGQQENTNHLSSEKMARDSWSDCQDKEVGKKALIGLPCQCLILISSPLSMKGKSPLNTWRNMGGTRRNQVSHFLGNRNVQAWLEVGMKVVHISFWTQQTICNKKARVLGSSLPGICCTIPGKSFSFSGPLFAQRMKAWIKSKVT